MFSTDKDMVVHRIAGMVCECPDGPVNAIRWRQAATAGAIAQCLVPRASGKVPSPTPVSLWVYCLK